MLRVRCKAEGAEGEGGARPMQSVSRRGESSGRPEHLPLLLHPHLLRLPQGAHLHPMQNPSPALLATLHQMYKCMLLLRDWASQPLGVH